MVKDIVMMGCSFDFSVLTPLILCHGDQRYCDGGLRVKLTVQTPYTLFELHSKYIKRFSWQFDNYHIKLIS